MGDGNVRLFLSCVSDEFGTYRDELRRKLTRPNVEVKIQEDFKALGGDTLTMLEEYIAGCDAVVHFVGEMAGSGPARSSADDLVARNPRLAARLAAKGMPPDALATLTYTQWEAWLAVGFDVDLLIVAPAEGVVRGAGFAPTDASRASQARHLKCLRAINRYPGPPFTNADALVAQIFASAVIDALVKAAAKPIRQPRNLPFASLGELFVGRETALDELRAALLSAKGAAIAGRALHGLGGIGKTRLAIEYAWAHAGEYSALLFVRADERGGARCGSRRARQRRGARPAREGGAQDAAKIEAVLRWLEAHPTWLLILDNVDDEQAVAAVVEAPAAAQRRACRRHRAGVELPRVAANPRNRRARRRFRHAVPHRTNARQAGRGGRRRGAGGGHRRTNSAASRSGSNRRAPISPSFASPLPAT